MQGKKIKRIKDLERALEDLYIMVDGVSIQAEEIKIIASDIGEEIEKLVLPCMHRFQEDLLGNSLGSAEQVGSPIIDVLEFVEEFKRIEYNKNGIYNFR